MMRYLLRAQAAILMPNVSCVCSSTWVRRHLQLALRALMLHLQEDILQLCASFFVILAQLRDAQNFSRGAMPLEEHRYTMRQCALTELPVSRA